MNVQVRKNVVRKHVFSRGMHFSLFIIALQTCVMSIFKLECKNYSNFNAVVCNIQFCFNWLHKFPSRKT